MGGAFLEGGARYSFLYSVMDDKVLARLEQLERTVMEQQVQLATLTQAIDIRHPKHQQSDLYYGLRNEMCEGMCNDVFRRVEDIGQDMAQNFGDRIGSWCDQNMDRIILQHLERHVG